MVIIVLGSIISLVLFTNILDYTALNLTLPRFCEQLENNKDIKAGFPKLNICTINTYCETVQKDTSEAAKELYNENCVANEK